MSYCLLGKGGEFHAQNLIWQDLLNLARMHGWSPEGALVNEITRDGLSYHYTGERGPYFGSECNLVTTEDAAHMASALRRVLGIVDNEPSAGDLEKYSLSSDRLWCTTQSGRSYVQEFIAFCEAGEFNIGG